MGSLQTSHQSPLATPLASSPSDFRSLIALDLNFQTLPALFKLLVQFAEFYRPLLVGIRCTYRLPRYQYRPQNIVKSQLPLWHTPGNTRSNFGSDARPAILIQPGTFIWPNVFLVGVFIVIFLYG